MLSALQLLKNELKSAHDTFIATSADIKEDDVNKSSGGLAFSIGVTYAHLLFSEDGIMQGMVLAKVPFFVSTWKDKTGTDLPYPAMDENWEKNNREWSNNVRVDIAQMRDYAKAVFAATDEYVNSLKDEDVDKEIDLGAWGRKTVAEVLSSFIIAHTNQLTGELSTLKGIHGSKGYPF